MEKQVAYLLSNNDISKPTIFKFKQRMRKEYQLTYLIDLEHQKNKHSKRTEDKVDIVIGTHRLLRKDVNLMT